MTAPSVRISGAELEAGSPPVDLRLEGEVVVAVAPELPARSGEPTLCADGGALLPGLVDHHIHLMALAAEAGSVACGPPAVRDSAGLEAILRDAAEAGGASGWIRGVGYHESVAGPLDAARLDAAVPDVPVRVQHRSGSAWFLNSAALEALGLQAGEAPPGLERDARGRPTGRLFRLDGWLRHRLGRRPPPELPPVGRWLAAVGVTAVSDATPDPERDALAHLADARKDRSLPQKVRVMPGPSVEVPKGLELGPVKLMLDEPRLPEIGAFVARIRAAHAAGRGVAIHAVTRAELVFACAALEEAGCGPADRLEHASVAPPEVLELIRALGVTVVTQPGFLFERGDAYLEDVAAVDRPWLYRGRGFDSCGIPLAAGTDAPFGRPDPWLSMRSAVQRRSRGGALLGSEEALSPERALALFTTPADAPGASPRRVEVGAPADLCLLRLPWREARERLEACDVRATIIAGRIAYEAASNESGEATWPS